PSARKQALGPRTLSLACLATALKAIGSTGTKSSCARRFRGKPEKAIKFTPASRSRLRARAPSPALSGASILKYEAIRTKSAMAPPPYHACWAQHADQLCRAVQYHKSFLRIEAPFNQIFVKATTVASSPIRTDRTA